MTRLSVVAAAGLLAGCGKPTEIILRPIVFSKTDSGVVHLDSHAIVVVSTFGGFPNNIQDYAIWPVWPDTEQTSRTLRSPRIRLPMIHGGGGYHAFAISKDSLYSSGTHREEWSDTFDWPTEEMAKFDSFFVGRTLEEAVLLEIVEGHTQGARNRQRFFSPEMRPLLQALRRRACHLSGVMVSEENVERWNDTKGLLSIPDSCGSVAPR